MSAIKPMKHLVAAFGLGLVAISGLARAEIVISVSQVNYNYRNEPLCTVVRMNPATFGSLPSDPCSQATLGVNGPDRITQNVYDAAGQLLAVYQGVGTSTIRQYAYYNYTNNGLKAFEIDANHNKTTFTYDGFDRLSKVQYPNTIAGNEISSTTDYETFGYDTNSNRTSWRHRNAQTVLYTYDNMNRETLKDLPAYAGSTATSKDIYTSYDGLGHIVYKRFASASGSGVTYYYDGLGRLSATTDMNGRSVWYNYFDNSQRSLMTFPDSQGQYYYYNNDGALQWVGIAGGSVSQTIYYDGLSRVTAVGRNNSANSYYTYDNIGHLTAMAHDFSGAANDIYWSFNSYNPAGQIAGWNASTSVYDYVETATTAENRAYDGLNRDASIAAVSGGYDAAGNMANDGVRIFTYDVENRLLTGAGTLTALNMEYDPEGRLYRYSYNGTQTSFLYDGTNLIGEYDSGGNMLKRYMHTQGTDQPWVVFDGSGVSTSTATYIYSNYQGSVIAIADMSGNVTNLYKYGPYGEPKSAINVDSWSGFRFRYTGQVMLGDARLYYYKARVYDPNFGRFLQTDPIGSDDDLDPYAYVGNDPINATDPTGMASFDSSWLAYKLDSQDRDDDKPTEIVVTGQRRVCDATCNAGMINQMASAQYLRIQSFSLGILPEEFGPMIEFGKAGAEFGFKTLGEMFKNGRVPSEQELVEFAKSQGWKEAPQGSGPRKFLDPNGIPRIIIKEGSARTPGSEQPHAEFRNAEGNRISPDGRLVPRKSIENHSPITLGGTIV